MGKVERIEQEIQTLSPEELAQLRVWLLEYDWAAWDRQLEAMFRPVGLTRLRTKPFVK